MERAWFALPEKFAGLAVYAGRLGTVSAIATSRRRYCLFGSHGQSHGTGPNMDVYSIGQRKRQLAVKHTMSSGRTNRARNKKMARGFSLIELMIAMVVLAVGLLGGIMVIGVAKANNGRSKLHTTAVTLAESTMEKIVAIPRSATAAAAGTK